MNLKLFALIVAASAKACRADEDHILIPQKTKRGRALTSHNLRNQEPILNDRRRHLAGTGSQKVAFLAGESLGCGEDHETTANTMFTHNYAGGCLPIEVGEINEFEFEALELDDVNGDSLEDFDTLVLNMASRAIGCTSNSLPEGVRNAIIAFVQEGNKLIIYDSECRGVDYSWLPFNFETVGHGPHGQVNGGTLEIVEDNTLSTSRANRDCTGSPAYCIDLAHLQLMTDAAGDANVMTQSRNVNWCVDILATNHDEDTGPVHAYVKFPFDQDAGLVIYNGLDIGYLTSQYSSGQQDLTKLWLQELRQPFNPSDLPCTPTVITITLEPDAAQYEVNDIHTVNATVQDQDGTSKEHIPVIFFIISGPNEGESGTGLTGLDGKTQWEYSSTVEGVDEIQACLRDIPTICSNIVNCTWDDSSRSSTDPPLVLNCTNATASPANITDLTGDMVTIEISGALEGELDGLVSYTVTDIIQDQSVDGKNSNREYTCPDGDLVIPAVRAEVLYKTSSRVYELTFNATLLGGQSCEGTARVCVHGKKTAKSGKKGGTAESGGGGVQCEMGDVTYDSTLDTGEYCPV